LNLSNTDADYTIKDSEIHKYYTLNFKGKPT
jgi:hypothetical protein